MRAWIVGEVLGTFDEIEMFEADLLCLRQEMGKGTTHKGKFLYRGSRMFDSGEI